MMLTRSTRRFALFRSLCEDLWRNRRDEEWYDREAMTRALQCETIRQVWHEVVLPYNETYFREELQSLWDTAGHLARRHELSSSSYDNTDARRAGVRRLSTPL